MLLLTDKYIDRTTMKRPILTYLVLQESAIVLLHILRQVGIEHKRRNRCIGQLSAILDLDVLAFHTLWRVSLDDRQHHLVQLGSTDVSLSVLINLLSSFQHLKNTLFGIALEWGSRGRWFESSHSDQVRIPKGIRTFSFFLECPGLGKYLLFPIE